MNTVTTPTEVDLAALASVRAAVGQPADGDETDAKSSEWFMARFDAFLDRVRINAETEHRMAIAGGRAPEPRISNAPDIAAELAECGSDATAVAVERRPSDEEPEGFETVFWRDRDRPWSGVLSVTVIARVLEGAGALAIAVAAFLQLG